MVGGSLTFDQLDIPASRDVSIQASSSIHVNQDFMINSGSSFNIPNGGVATVTVAGNMTVQSSASFNTSIGGAAINIAVTGDLAVQGTINGNIDNLSADNITIFSGALVSANCYGHRGGRQGSNTGYHGAGPGGGTYSGPYPGGTHGGFAANESETIQSHTYGSIFAPVDLGSGGATYSTNYRGADGGGRIKLTANAALTIDGTIRAEGCGNPNRGGGGSGGSVYLIADSIAGAGALSVNGSNYSYTNGSNGGGGRIAAIAATANSFSGTASMHTGTAGDSTRLSGAGTYYKKVGSDHGELIVDNGGYNGNYTLVNQVPASGFYTKITVKGKAKILFDGITVPNDPPIEIVDEGTIDYASTNATFTDANAISDVCGTTCTFKGDNLTFDYLDIPGGKSINIQASSALAINQDMTVQSGATFSASIAGAPMDFTVTGDLTIQGTVNGNIENITAANISLLSGGLINATCYGNRGGRQGSNTGYHGAGPGGGTYSGPYPGGSYGGYAFNESETIQNHTYGSIFAPVDLGSGGATYSTSYRGADGGGRIKLTATGAFAIEGTIQADGCSNPNRGGGGSGGSIYLIADSFSGSGELSAIGSSYSYSNGSHGGGGRIAMIATTSDSYSGNLYMHSGGPVSSSRYAGAGTFYRKVGSNHGDLIVDNAGLDGETTYINQVPASGFYDSITVKGSAHVLIGSALTVPGGFSFNVLDNASVSYE